mgnify:CR=1 FL=1
MAHNSTIVQDIKKSVQNFNLNVMAKLLNRFKKFPMVNMPMALVNTFSMQLPVFILSTYFNAEVIGFYMMANRILMTPIQLISRAIGRVYYKEASDAFSINKEKLKTIFKNTVSQTAKIGLLPSLFIIPVAPILTNLIALLTEFFCKFFGVSKILKSLSKNSL